MQRSLHCLLALLLISLPAHAGTADKPEVTDPKGDGGVDQLDILAVWVDTGDALNLTFHLTMAADVPAYPHDASVCSGSNCFFQSFSWRIIFRVLDPDGKPAPRMADYNRSYVVFRDGPQSGGLGAAVGSFGKDDVLTLAGNVTATVSGKEIVLRVDRSAPAVNMPKGPAPGAYTIDHLYAYDSPQACFPAQTVPQVGTVQCAPMSKPTAGGAVAQWDVAPDSGYGNQTVFPAAPPTAQTTTSSSTTTTTSSTSHSTTSTSSTSVTTTSRTTTIESTTTIAPIASLPTTNKGTPALPVIGLVGALGLALLRRQVR